MSAESPTGTDEVQDDAQDAANEAVAGTAFPPVTEATSMIALDHEDDKALSEPPAPPTLKIKPLRIGAHILNAYPGDAGIDLAFSPSDGKTTVIRPGTVELLETGIAVAIPEGYAGFILPRSGMASKRGLRPINTPGLIDSGYRGEVLVPIEAVLNRQVVSPGERIAQLVVVPVPSLDIEVVRELDDTARGSNGFGSSGS